MLCSLLCILSLFLLLVSSGLSQPLTLPPLPYAYDALEPVISEATMRSHHLSHHQSYTDKTNAVLTALRTEPTTKHLSKLGLDHLIRHIHNLSVPLTDPQRVQLRNHGGGYLNHVHFFESLTPPLSSSGTGTGSDGVGIVGNRSLEGMVDLLPVSGSQVAALIDRSFGSFEAFKEVLTTAALGVFGSGWVWLTFSPALHSLSIQSTELQDSPWMEEAWVESGGVVLLGLDVWEHAYYLDWQSKRAEYVRSWWKVVDWARVEQRLIDGHKGSTGAGSRTHHELR